MSKILRYLACLFMLIFVGNALAAGYSCPTYKKYTSCASGYYMTSSSTSTTCNTTPAAGNACRPCSAYGTGYTCAGGTACPKRSSVTCSPGYYLPANATSCSTCGGNNYYCPGGTYNVSSSAQGRNTVSSGYYSTGGTSTTRTGQSQCTGATYCTSGVQYSCPSGYTANTTAGKTAASSCQISVSKGHYIASANSSTASNCAAGTYRAAHTVNYGSTSSCSSCPSGYTSASGTAGATTECYISVSGGKYIGTANSSTQSTCAAGTYKAAHTVYYGSTSSCSACTGRTKYSAAGASACSTVSSGYYTTGCNSSNNNCTGQSQCTGATYCTSGVQYSCPSGYTANTTAGKTAASSCQISCSGGTYVATANAACTSVGTGYYRAAHTVNYGSTSTRNACPSGYPNSDAGAGAITSCYSNSKSRAWTGSQVNGSVPTNCATVESWNSCSNPACSYVAYANSAGTGDGTIKSGCSTNNASCTRTPASVTADAGYYDAGTSCAACPSGYPNSDDGNEGGVTQCYSNTKSRAWTGSQTACTKPTGCYAVTCNSCSNPACSYVAYANSAGTGDGTIKSGCSTNNASCTQTVNTVTANAGRYVSGKTCPACAVGTFQGADDSTATSCTVCAANTYAASTGMSACTACPSGYSTSGTAASNHDAKSDCSITCAAGTRVVTADAACTTPSGSWYTAAHTVTAGSTTPDATVKACLTNYSTPNTTTRTDHDASTDCKISCAAGTRITAENATSCTTPAGNWYVGAHSVAQGSISTYSNCLTNYTISGTAAANHDTASDCKISCGGGSYIATANNTTCSDVGAGYWAAASTVSQGSAGVRNACDDGLTTIGSGAGADEVGDCGRVLNVNGEKIYLRSERKTTPSLNVSINGTTFYGNMGASGIGALKLNSGGTTYSVYDDSME